MLGLLLRTGNVCRHRSFTLFWLPVAGDNFIHRLGAPHAVLRVLLVSQNYQPRQLLELCSDQRMAPTMAEASSIFSSTGSSGSTGSTASECYSNSQQAAMRQGMAVYTPQLRQQQDEQPGWVKSIASLLFASPCCAEYDQKCTVLCCANRLGSNRKLLGRFRSRRLMRVTSRPCSHPLATYALRFFLLAYSLSLCCP